MSLRKISVALTSVVVLAAGIPAFAQSNGNSVVHNNVVNSLGSSTPITVNRESHSVINNPGIGNVHVDNNLVLSGSCGKSKVHNNVSHQGSIGASTNVVVDVCIPDTSGNLPGIRHHRRR